MPVIHDTFVIQRSYPKPPVRVFAAFSDPVQKQRWYGEADHQSVEHFEIDFRVGGAERIRYRMNEKTPFPGVEIVNEGVHQEIIPDRRIVVASLMTLGGRRISATLVTFEFEATSEGTRLTCTHQAAFFEGADGPEMRKGGWQALFDKLAKALADA